MTLTTIFKCSLAFIVILIVLLTIVVLRKGPLGTPLQTSGGNSDLEEGEPTAPVATIPLLLQRTAVVGANASYTLSADSESRIVSAVSLRLDLGPDLRQAETIFALDPHLQASGWQVVINKHTTSADRSSASFELALINAQPGGGAILNNDVPLGVLTTPLTASISLDPTVSMASSQEGEQLNFKLNIQE